MWKRSAFWVTFRRKDILDSFLIYKRYQMIRKKDQEISMSSLTFDICYI